MTMTERDGSPSFPTREAVDFVIIGSGASGGVLAKELSTNGFDVVVLEQGAYRTAADFTHDEMAVFFQNELMNHPGWNDPQTFRTNDKDTAVTTQGGPPPAFYARGVGGSSVHFTANYWRFHQSDFKERSLLGPMQGTGFVDWPISYEELEPYYTKVDWECGISGEPGPFDAPRSRPYPVPPLPVKSSGVLFEQGAKAMGLHPQAAPMAILSEPHNGRPACIHCGFCMGFGCEANAKSSTLASMIPLAEASGRCEIRPLSTVFKIETNDQGRVTEVVYLDADGQQQAQKAKAVIVAANGAETPRLLFLSESARSPDGLANSSGIVGKYLMGNGHSVTQLERNNITLDPTVKDDKGRAAIRMTYMDHDDDLSMALFLQDRAVEILEAAGANKVWRDDVIGGTIQAHLLGTCRMGDDPTTSVVDKYHRAHDVPNLFICDGSSFVSSGRGQPTMTIQALAFRAAEHIANFARRGEI
jgi:choline dehydrogenase-like flavoprotein